MAPSGYRVSHLYHKALNPTTVPMIIDNKLFILTEQLSRHVVDTKLSFLIPYPEINNYNNIPIPIPVYCQVPPPSPPIQPQPQPSQWCNIGECNPMMGNVAQQLNLERMHAQFAMDYQNAINSQANYQSSMKDASTNASPWLHRDASTHTYDLNLPLSLSSDVEMKSVQ